MVLVKQGKPGPVGSAGPIHGDLYTGTQVETPDTAKSEPTGRAPAPYPERRLFSDPPPKHRWGNERKRGANRGELQASGGTPPRRRGDEKAGDRICDRLTGIRLVVGEAR